MGGFLQFAASMREHMHATLSRSDVLKALVWPIGLIMSAIVALVFGNAPQWLLIVFVVLLTLAILLYGVAYVFCLIKDRDALRSEKYSLHKMALERGVFGDDKLGIIEGEAVPVPKKKKLSIAPTRPESGQ